MAVISETPTAPEKHSFFRIGALMLCVYLTAAFFIFVVPGAIAYFHNFNILKFFLYIKEELFIVLGTSSSESALPRMMVKLEKLAVPNQSSVWLLRPAILLIWTARRFI